MRPSTGVLAALLLISALHAQKPVPIPSRPRLDATADTNSADAYYRYGIRQISDKPGESVRAFYWALQIDPSSAETMYALRSAKLLAMAPSELYSYFDWSKKKRDANYLALDSLLYRAYAANPFVHQNLELPLIRAYTEAVTINEYPSVDRAELHVHVLDAMVTMRRTGWLSQAEGRMADALESYAKQLHDKSRNKKDHEDNDSEIHADRARVFYLMGNLDSSRAEMTQAIAGMRKHDEKDVVILYESKALYEQSLGIINERASKSDEAQDAYGKALEEDLSYYAAHNRLAQLQLARGDTAGAQTEMDLAVQLQPNDPALRYSYALVLLKSRKDADAASQLLKAIAAGPFYAPPHFLLARIADAEQYTDDAVAEYGHFIALAAKNDPQLPMAHDRLSKLTATVASAPAAVPPAAKP